MSVDARIHFFDLRCKEKDCEHYEKYEIVKQQIQQNIL